MKRNYLANCRKCKNKTQADMALDLGISEVYVRKIESGVSSPGLELILKYGRYFGKDIKELFPDIFLSIYDTKCI